MMVSVKLSPTGPHHVGPEVAFDSIAAPTASTASTASTGRAGSGSSAGQAGSTASVPVGELRHESRLGAGVRLVIDPASPDQWHAVRVDSLDATAEPLVQALVGVDATALVAHRLDELRSRSTHDAARPMVEQITVDASGADPWLRVAATDALDRWLQLPLDQSLVDAERGIARSRAAMTLPDGAPARQVVIADALQIARRASRGVASYLAGLSKLRQPPPAGLLIALKQLVDGYDVLTGEVKGPDRDLRKVLTRWSAMGERAATGAAPAEQRAHGQGPPKRRGSGGGAVQDARAVQDGRAVQGGGAALDAQDAAAPADRLVNLIDPRQVRARVFAVTAQPVFAEVSMLEAAQVGGREEPLVLVRALAYGPVTAESGFGARMLVRLVDRRSGQSRSEALLTLAPDRQARASGDAVPLVFSSTVPLRGARIDDLRADVFDALSDLPPAAADSDVALQNVLRAVRSLRELRRLVAETRMPSFAGKRILHRTGPRDAALAGVQGPGDLLVAELAAAHQAGAQE